MAGKTIISLKIDISTFIDPETGAITTSFEGTWKAVKHHILPKSHTIKVRTHLTTFVWRHNNRNDL